MLWIHCRGLASEFAIEGVMVLEKFAMRKAIVSDVATMTLLSSDSYFEMSPCQIIVIVRCPGCTNNAKAVRAQITNCRAIDMVGCSVLGMLGTIKN